MLRRLVSFILGNSEAGRSGRELIFCLSSDARCFENKHLETAETKHERHSLTRKHIFVVYVPINR